MKHRDVSELAFWHPKKNRTRTKRAVAILATVGLAGSLCAGIAGAAVTSPSQNQVIRGGAVPLAEDAGSVKRNRDGSIYNATTNPGSTSSTSPTATGAGCVHTKFWLNTTWSGTPLIDSAANSVGKGVITITNPNNVVVATIESPEHEVSRSATAASSTMLLDRNGPWTGSWTIPDGAVPGTYTITSTAIDAKRNATGSGCTAQAPRLLGTRQFIFRPWENKFSDLFGNGDVSFNLNPPEWQATALGNSTPIFSGVGTMHAYAISDPTTFTVPADPTPCGTNPQSCLPAGAVECAPGNAACVPRVVTINWGAGPNSVDGVFDLQTKVFIAYVNYNGTTEVLLSLGTDGDAQFRDVLAQLAAQAASQGIDLMSLLATKVRVTVNQQNGSSTVIDVSLLRALQIYTQKPGGATGVNIVAPITATVGLFAHTYSFTGAPNPTGLARDAKGCSTVRTAAQTSPGRCTTSATATDSVGRFTPQSALGYHVLKSDLLPDLPTLTLPALPAVPGLPVSTATVASLAALGTGAVPTKFFNIYGAWPTGTHTPKIGVDTNPGEPNGLPVWVAPLSLIPADPTTLTNTTVLLTIAFQVAFGIGLPSFPDRAMDFLGTAAWATSETCTATVGTTLGTCSGSGSMSGLGVGIFSAAPLPIGFRNIPIWDPQDPQVVALIAQINAAIASTQAQANAQVAALLADPTVQMVLTTIFGAIPPGTIPPVPTV